MIVRIRQCCCALPTFVRLVAVFFLVFHLLLALSAAIWYTLFSTNSPNEVRNFQVANEVDDKTFENGGSSTDEEKEYAAQERSLDLLIVILLGIFAACGVIVNLMLLLGIKVNQRTYFLPWLVFHLINVMGRS